ncbi:MAG: hypothetical protein ACRD0N_06075, partial [Acidimicrobiales bacterium]
PPPRPAPAPSRPMAEPEPVTAQTPVMGSDDGFPIAGYDTLRASQIIAQLDDLSLDELDMVREREEQGKNRATVVRQVDVRIEALEGEVAPEPAPAAPAEPFPAAAEEEFAPAAPDDVFPIPDYDDHSADEIIALLDDLDDEEIDMVAEREERGLNRLEILEYIDDMFEEVGPDGQPVAAPPAAMAMPAPPAPVAKKAAVKRAAVKKAAGKAAGKKAAVKAVPSKAPSAVKRAAVKKAAAVKAPARTAAVKAGAGGAAKKAAAGASPGTKSAAKKAAAKRAAAVKKR